MRASILLILVLGLVAYVAYAKEAPKTARPGDAELGQTFDRIKENLKKQIDSAAAAGDTKKVQELEKRLESMLKNEQKVKGVAGGMGGMASNGGKPSERKTLEDFKNHRKNFKPPTRKDEL